MFLNDLIKMVIGELSVVTEKLRRCRVRPIIILGDILLKFNRELFILLSKARVSLAMCIGIEADF